MEKAFIIGAYFADTDFEIGDNIIRAREAAGCAWAIGYATLCPHLNTAFFGGKTSEDNFKKGYLLWLADTDIAITVPGWERSDGSREEVKFCRETGKPLYHSNGAFNSLDELVIDDPEIHTF